MKPLISFFRKIFKLDNVSFSRIFNSNKGSLEVVKDKNSYIWKADNFPLDELELLSLIHI